MEDGLGSSSSSSSCSAGTLRRVTFPWPRSGSEKAAPVVHLVPALDDNYVHLVETAAGQRLVVDPSEAAPVLQAVRDLQWPTVDGVLITHHHSDHVGGNREIKQAFPDCIVVGPRPALSQQPVPCLEPENAVAEGDDLSRLPLFKGVPLDSVPRVLDTPGHTLDHITFVFGGASETCSLDDEPVMVFCGDTLFSLGCGKLFEGTAADMFSSLEKLKKLPPRATLFCAHEYSESNAAFAVAVAAEEHGRVVDGAYLYPSIGSEGEERPGRNENALSGRVKHIREARARGVPTLPASLADEMLANPFLLAVTEKAFADVRRRKDKF